MSYNGNYAVCRAEMRARPGLPFLFPLFREYCSNGDAVLREVFSFVSYDMQRKPALDQRAIPYWRQFVTRKRRVL